MFLSFQIYKSIQIKLLTIVIFKIIHIVIYFRRNFHDVGIYLNAVLDMEVFMLTVLLVPLSLGGRLTKGICSYDVIRLPCIYNFMKLTTSNFIHIYMIFLFKKMKR